MPPTTDLLSKSANDTPSRPLYSPPERDAHLSALTQEYLDVLVVGGGINGAVACAALAGGGATVGLIDAGDFAGGVSSSSSNLAWGGIKYLVR